MVFFSKAQWKYSKLDTFPFYIVNFVIVQFSKYKNYWTVFSENSNSNPSTPTTCYPKIAYIYAFFFAHLNQKNTVAQTTFATPYIQENLSSTSSPFATTSSPARSTFIRISRYRRRASLCTKGPKGGCSTRAPRVQGPGRALSGRAPWKGFNTARLYTRSLSLSLARAYCVFIYICTSRRCGVVGVSLSACNSLSLFSLSRSRLRARALLMRSYRVPFGLLSFCRGRENWYRALCKWTISRRQSGVWCGVWFLRLVRMFSVRMDFSGFSFFFCNLTILTCSNIIYLRNVYLLQYRNRKEYF